LKSRSLNKKVSMLEKQAKVQPSQDNHRNMMNKLEKGKPRLSLLVNNKWSSLITRRKKMPILMKNWICKKCILKCKEVTHQKWYWLQKWWQAQFKSKLKWQGVHQVYQEKKQSPNNTNHVSYASNANASYVSHMSYHEFDASYVLMRNKFDIIVALYVGHHHKRSKTFVWMLKCLVTNLKGPKQVWLPKNKTWIIL
jgi:hypothetical protein